MPNIINLYITDNCNLRCKHCYVDFSNKLNELTFENINDIVNKFIDFFPEHKIDCINILGGEPFVHPNIEEIIKFCSEKAKVRLSTNSLMLPNINVEILKLLDYIQFSTESLQEDTANYYRGEGFYKRLLNSIKIIKKINVKFGFKFTITKQNFNAIEKEYQLAKELGANRISIGRLIPIGNGKEIQEQCVNSEQLKTVIDKTILFMIKNKIKFSMSDGLWNCEIAILMKSVENIKFTGCTAGDKNLCVIPDGSILLCRRLNIPIGNIFSNQSLSEIYENSNVVKKLTNRELKGKCGKCNYNNICGGCRAYVYALNGDLYNEDPMCFINK